MNRKELAYTIRTDAKEIEAVIKKLQYRCDHLKWLADQLEAVGKRPEEKEGPPSKFRKMVDKIYGEKR
jgi:hypothetical protein